MTRRFCQMLSLLAVIVLITVATGVAKAQSGSQGTIVVTVQDTSGGVVPDANLSLVAVATNDTHTAKTKGEGNYTFVNLPIGIYKLTAAKQGYTTTLQPVVVVEAAQTTDLHLTLKIGSAAEIITVTSSATPLLETTQNSLVTVIDQKFVEDLPMIGRELTYFATLVPGYAGQPQAGASGGNGSWDGKLSTDGGSDIDGVPTAASRGKGSGNVGAGVSTRVEDIEQISVQSDQIDVDQGFGQNSMQVSAVTRSGTNKFHGRAFGDMQNDGLNANTWAHDAAKIRKGKLIYEDWGVSVGGPVLRNKLFFFGTFAMRQIPGTYDSGATTLSTAAQAGNFSWVTTDSTGASQTSTANVYSLAAAAGVTLNPTPDATVASQLGLINTNAIPAGQINTVAGDSNINSLSWKEENSRKYYYPLVRLDYNMNSKVRMGLSWNDTKYSAPNQYGPFMPGSSFANQTTGYTSNQYISSYRLDWDMSPNVENQVRLGYLYNYGCYSCAAPKPTTPQVFWALGSSGQQFYTPQSREYPLFNLSDTMSVQKKAHTIKFGYSGYREQDHYWNPLAGYWNTYLGMDGSDPALNAFSQATMPNANPGQVGEAQALYATLTGRVTYIGTSHALNPATGQYETGTGAYNLDERSMAWGLYAQDSWRITPTLTLNYGMRWDFTGDNHDLTGAYHNLAPSAVYGPTPVGALFQPGNLGGNNYPEFTLNPHAYAPWHKTPQPQVGIAWNPRVDSGILGKLFGGSDTVIRSGVSLKRFTEPYQSYWNFASDYGSFFYNNSFYTTGSPTWGAGYFNPGSLTLNSAIANYPSTVISNHFSTSPSTYQTSASESQFTFEGGPGIVGMDPKIPEPDIISWNLGIQRKLGATRALEVRYVANRSYHQWMAVDTNEVNIFENGFLSEFQIAQANQKINYANQKGANPGQTLSTTSFANLGYAGQQNLPIIGTAFTGENVDSNNSYIDYTNGNYDQWVANGAAGSLAATLAGINGPVPYICNLVGPSFTPCANNLGYPATGPYPMNFFQANPYAGGNSAAYLTGMGYSTYESLQTQFQQQQWRGLQVEANYTWSHSLGNGGESSGGTGTGGNLGAGSNPVLTMHDPKKNYRPSPFDIRHVLHVNGTYDLPIGWGKMWLSDNRLVSRIAGNWTVGSIVTMQTGMPTKLIGGWATYNDYSDGGVTLSNGMTASKLQHAVGVHRVPSSQLGGAPSQVLMIDPKYLASSSLGGANSTYIQPNTTPGTYGSIIYLHGPHGFYQDLSVSKGFPTVKQVKIKFQAEIQNVWNHPVFGNAGTFMDVNVQDTSFAQQGGTSNSPRAMDMRLNIEF